MSKNNEVRLYKKDNKNIFVQDYVIDFYNWCPEENNDPVGVGEIKLYRKKEYELKKF